MDHHASPDRLLRRLGSPPPEPGSPPPTGAPADPPAIRSDVELPVLGGPVPAPSPPEPSLPDPVPFPEELLRPAIDAATRLWEPLAARAWAETARRGRGLLAIRWEELRDAADAAARGVDVEPPATWIPVTIVSRGDDFRGLLQRYDIHRQVMLLVGHESGGEAVFGLECEGETRPTPEACFERRAGRRERGEPADGVPPPPPTPTSDPPDPPDPPAP